MLGLPWDICLVATLVDSDALTQPRAHPRGWLTVRRQGKIDTVIADRARRNTKRGRTNDADKNGAGAPTRTGDLLITNQLLYQLSYTGFGETLE